MESKNKNSIKKISVMINKILGRNLNMGKYSDRLLLQKLVYIMQNLGLDSNYTFSWYIRGPYSPELANAYDEFSLKYPRGEAILGRKEKEIVEKMKEVFGIELNNSEKMELYASLVYLFKEEKIPLESLERVIKLRKPWFSSNEIKKGIEILRQLGVTT
ncbi:hypothetical protein DRN50_04715 [Thermococci archaeon]|nr:MAG: hypothetical protein DRN50_04715 [Thermococci archaeon]